MNKQGKGKKEPKEKKEKTVKAEKTEEKDLKDRTGTATRKPQENPADVDRKNPDPPVGPGG